MQTAFAKEKKNLTLTCPALTPPLLFYNAGGVLNCFAPSFNSAKLILRSEKDRMAGETRPAEISWRDGFLPIGVKQEARGVRLGHSGSAAAKCVWQKKK